MATRVIDGEHDGTDVVLPVKRRDGYATTASVLAGYVSFASIRPVPDRPPCTDGTVRRRIRPRHLDSDAGR